MQIIISRIENGYVVTVNGLAERQNLGPLVIFAPNWVTVSKLLEEYRPEETSLSGN